MTDSGRIYLKWNYTPTDFFEEKETNLLPGYEHIIDNGLVTVSMDLSQFQNFPGIEHQLGEQLRSIFRGSNLISQKPFTLKYAGHEIVDSEGHRHITVALEPVHLVMKVGKTDLIVKDANGKIVADTRQERQDKLRKLSVLSFKHSQSDPVAGSILVSFEKSLQHAETSLVHLFEIQEALSTRFSGEAIAKRELGITNAQWKRLGRLANDEPLNQGRHSGVHIDGLRDATKSELDEARDSAIGMVIAYLEYLERNSPA